LDGEVAADNEENKGSQALKEVVGELDKKLEVVHFQTDLEQAGSRASQLLVFKLIPGVPLDLVHPGNGLTNDVAHGPGDLDAVAVQAVEAFLEEGNNNDFNRIDG